MKIIANLVLIILMIPMFTIAGALTIIRTLYIFTIGMAWDTSTKWINKMIIYIDKALKKIVG